MSNESATIRFYLNGELTEVQSPPPTTTVLNYLREQAGLRGTKEGCAEGDCGACTTVLVEVEDEKARIRPINACIQFLPTLDGKALYTVEGLCAPGSDLHPVQEAMVQCHGSQCGFCTPGFVMSLFALYKTHASPDTAEINLALSGNLCRCTGYRPILDAARRMHGLGPANHDGVSTSDWCRIPAGADGQISADDVLIEQLQSLKRSQSIQYEASSLQITPDWDKQRYFAPLSVDELVLLLETYPDATLLAGGTDIGLWVTKQHRPIATVIYIGQIDELRRVSATDTEIEIPAAVKLTDAFAVLIDEYPELREIVRRFASPPICNAGTLVGNVANGSPIGDSMPALICLGAVVILRKGTAIRHVSLDEFYLDYQLKDLDDEEFVQAVRIPRRPPGFQLRSYKWSKRFDQDISAVCIAVSGTMEGGIMMKPRICFGGLAAIPKRAIHAEHELADQALSESSIKNAAACLDQDFQPISDMRASSQARLQIARNLLTKFHADITDPQSTERVFDLEPMKT